MKKSITGYKKNSKDRNEPMLEIPGGNLTMQNVPHSVFAITPNGIEVMEPENNYRFNTSSTIEIPYKMKKQKGGTIKEFESYLSSLEETDQDELLDYMESMDYEDQQRFLGGGKVMWKSYQQGGLIDTSSLLQNSFAKGRSPIITKPEMGLSDYADQLDRKKLQLRLAAAKNSSSTPMALSFIGGNNKSKSNDRFREKEFGGSIYQDGGQNNMSLVEVEGKETIVKPNGELYKFEGPTHKGGGIDILAEPGSKIFSHHSKAPSELIKTVLGKETKKKMSYADISKKFDTTKWSKILQNPDSDEYEKKTAELKMSGNLAMLETIFQTQEEEKMVTGKGKMQYGGPVLPQKKMYTSFWDTYLDKQMGNDQDPLEISQSLTPLQQIRSMYNNLPEATVIGKRPNYPGGSQYDLSVTETAPSGLASPPGRISSPVYTGQGMLPSATTELPIVDPGTSSLHRNYSVPSKSKNTSTKTTGRSSFPFSIKDEPAPEVDLNMSTPVVNDRSSLVEYTSQDTDTSPTTAVTKPAEAEKKKSDFGIGHKLAGTILDIGLAMSDNIHVKEPKLYDLRKTPLFTRFVDFDDKEAGRNLSLSIQQIQNSNMPEEVKQSRIADMNAQYQDHTAKVAFANAQRYEGKLNQDTEKLQTYINNNIDQHFQDTERYNEQKAKVDFLKDQFQAQRKSRIVNSLRNYLDYADEINMKNQILSEQYAINPITGKINFKKGKKDPLKDKEMEMNQYKQNSKNAVQLPNGASMTMINETTGIVTSSNGSVEIVKLK